MTKKIDCCKELNDKVKALEQIQFNRERDEEWNLYLKGKPLFITEGTTDDGRISISIEDTSYIDDNYDGYVCTQKKDTKSVDVYSFHVSKIALIPDSFMWKIIILGFLLGVIASIIVVAVF